MGKQSQISDGQVSGLNLYSRDIDVDHIDANKYLTFNLSDSLYGVGINLIKEIIEFGRITLVPMTPNYIRGVINLRGNVVPVIDLSARLGKEAKDITKRTCIIIVEMTMDNESTDIGFVVDLVNEVIDISVDCIEPAPSFGADIRVDFIAGMARLERDFTILLDLENVLSIVELSELNEVVGL